jgi:hypothetical protein
LIESIPIVTTCSGIEFLFLLLCYIPLPGWLHGNVRPHVHVDLSMSAICSILCVWSGELYNNVETRTLIHSLFAAIDREFCSYILDFCNDVIMKMRSIFLCYFRFRDASSWE